MNKLIKEENKVANKKILHYEALQSLCALQYYMSTLNTQSEDLKKINYALSFKLMYDIVNTLYKTIEISVDEINYPLELMIINNNLNNINIKLNLIG